MGVFTKKVLSQKFFNTFTFQRFIPNYFGFLWDNRYMEMRAAPYIEKKFVKMTPEELQEMHRKY